MDLCAVAARPGIDEVYSAVERVGWVQIDTLQVVRRAQYLTLWSRLGTYDPDHLDTLLFDNGSTCRHDNSRRLFEYWTHAACIIPLTQYRYTDADDATARHSEVADLAQASGYQTRRTRSW